MKARSAAIAIILLPCSGDLPGKITGVGIIAIFILVGIAAGDGVIAAQPARKIHVGATLGTERPIAFCGCIPAFRTYPVFDHALGLHGCR